jgi:peptide/nickel transport system ATP-binding protein
MKSESNAKPEELMLSVHDLVVEYRTQDEVVQAVNNLEIEIAPGKTLGLVGETGAGKTTTGLAIIRLLQGPRAVIRAGSVCFKGTQLLELSEKQMQSIRGKKISMIFQDPMTSLNPVMPVEKQIAESIQLHEKVSREEALAKAREMLETVGIPTERGREYQHQFSGGMKQRVVIAIALACKPELLIADEPTTALDVTIQAQVIEKIKELRQKYNTSMLMITHDLGIVAEVCDEVSVIYAGHIVEHGTLEDVFEYCLHPYTQGLFDSLPDINNRKLLLKPIEGIMPDPTCLPEGCAFSPRCHYATDNCGKCKPRRVYRTNQHYTECHLYREGDPVVSRVKNNG